MAMGIDGIGNGALLAHFDQITKQMNAMSQNASAASFNQLQNGQITPLNVNTIQGSSPFFDGATAAQALRDELPAAAAGLGVSSATNDTPLQQTTSAGQAVGEFKQLLQDAFENVNVLQNEAASLSTRFDLGDRSISLADVMLASQKSSLSFEATIQIRNKIVDAYQSIMQMQI